jgi:hypothetical protein
VCSLGHNTRYGRAKGESDKDFDGVAGACEITMLPGGHQSQGKILFINLGDVVSIQANGKYIWLRRNASSYLLRESISVVAERLETHGFIRIHRSVLVNTSCVEEIRPLSTGEYRLRVEGGKEYTVTRTYKKNLKSLAEFWIGTGTFPCG